MKNAKQYIEKQLKDLDVPKESQAYAYLHENAMAAAEVLSKKELAKYLVDMVNTLPPNHFE